MRHHEHWTSGTFSSNDAFNGSEGDIASWKTPDPGLNHYLLILRPYTIKEIQNTIWCIQIRRYCQSVPCHRLAFSMVRTTSLPGWERFRDTNLNHYLLFLRPYRIKEMRTTTDWNLISQRNRRRQDVNMHTHGPNGQHRREKSWCQLHQRLVSFTNTIFCP